VAGTLMEFFGFSTGNNIAAARLAGLTTDLNLTGVQYQVSGLVEMD
jgi:hypothetical protein